MRPELRNEMLRILEERFKGEMLPLHFGDEGLTFEAVYLLREYGALEETESIGAYRITIQGYDYYQKLKAPQVYWLRKNWFPVAILIFTSLVTVFADVISALLD